MATDYAWRLLVGHAKPFTSAGSVMLGFALSSMTAFAGLDAIGENPLAQGNMADVVLAGFVFGVPGGVICSRAFSDVFGSDRLQNC